MSKKELNFLVEQISEGSGSYAAGINKLKKYGEEAIVALLNAKSTHVSGVRDGRDSVADLLGAISELSKEHFEFAMNLLEKELAKPHNEQKYVSSLAWSLGGTGNKKAALLLTKCLKHQDKWIRWMCCESLLKLKSEKSIPALIEALKDRSEMVKSTAIIALKEFGNTDAIPALERISKLKNKILAENAMEAIKEIQKRFD